MYYHQHRKYSEWRYTSSIASCLEIKKVFVKTRFYWVDNISLLTCALISLLFMLLLWYYIYRYIIFYCFTLYKSDVTAMFIAKYRLIIVILIIILNPLIVCIALQIPIPKCRIFIILRSKCRWIRCKPPITHSASIINIIFVVLIHIY